MYKTFVIAEDGLNIVETFDLNKTDNLIF